MGNETAGRKLKKSQKRKDRQECRRIEQTKTPDNRDKTEIKPTIKPTKKSLPGFLAKNSRKILDWLNRYCILFCRADDYGIDRLDVYTEKQRQELVQTYVDIREFQKIVQEMLNANDVKDSEMLKLAETGQDADIKTESAEKTDPAQNPPENGCQLVPVLPNAPSPRFESEPLNNVSSESTTSTAGYSTLYITN